MKFDFLKNYLINNGCFGFFAKKRKTVIIYTFYRFYNKKRLTLKIMVSRKTKCVISVKHKDDVYTDFDDIRKLVEA